MPLAAGDRLGPYEIESLIGTGGMGEVYRARDLRLDRIVAIKVLSAQIDSPSARERFEQEARAVSSLNHPNICALYDLGNQDGRAYLVMEYLAGETLAARVKQGPLAIDEALAIATQMADALDRAHRQGVIHRDLKPGNIILTRSGAKLVDFGLAKINRVAPAPAGDSMDPTRTLTSQTALLGTCQYMAPELLEGKDADARCDIFAFGTVLYEMMTGRRAFDGATQPLIIASILEHEPPAITAEGERADPTVAALEHLVRTCLAKDPEERRQTAHDVLLELRWIAGEGAPARRGRGRARTAWLWAGIAAAGLLAGGIVLWRRPQPPVQARPLRVSILPPAKSTFVTASLPALAPDGRRLVFSAGAEGKSQLWVRDLDSLSAQPLAGTESASSPFWSADGSAVGFFAFGKLRTMKLSGGPAAPLCDAMQGRGASWSANGTIVFAPNTEDGLYRVPAAGGNATRVTTLDASLGELSHRWPSFLPDGRHFLYTARSPAAGKSAIYVADLDSPARQRLLAIGSNAAYAAPGFLLFVRERALMAVAFDAEHLRVNSEPFSIADPVDFIAANLQGSFAVAQTGTVVYYAGGGGLNSRLTWFDRDGKAAGTIGEPGSFVQPAISPDGARVAVDRMDPQTGTYDIWQYDVARGDASRLTFDPKQDGYPVWSPDGTRIAFSSNRDGHYDLYMKAVGGGKDEALVKSEAAKFASDWSRDGRYLIYYQIDAKSKTKYDLWVLPDPAGPSDGRNAFPYLASEFNEHRAKLSPDGHWLAYTSDETSNDEIYVQSFPAPGHKWKVSLHGGTRPVWSRDGKELYFIAADRKLMAAAVKAGAQLETGTPRPLFGTRQSITRFFDISPDGQRFLLVDPMEEGAPPMTLLVNWAAAVKRP